MKRLLSLLGGMMFLLSFETASADDAKPEHNDTGERMIRNEDLLKYNRDQHPGPDQDQGTVNVTPAKPGEGGSAPGGSGKPELKDDTGIPAPAEKTSRDPYDSERGKDDPYKAVNRNEQNTSRY